MGKHIATWQVVSDLVITLNQQVKVILLSGQQLKLVSSALDECSMFTPKPKKNLNWQLALQDVVQHSSREEEHVMSSALHIMLECSL